MLNQIPPDQRLEVIQNAIGKALWQIQAFENTLAHLITIVLKISPRTSLEQAEEILDDVRSTTLGRLLNETKKVVKFDDSFSFTMKKFLEERNWLVHRSWQTHRDFFSNDQEFIDLRYRISRLSSDAVEFNSFFAGVVESYVRAKGVSESDIQELSQEFTNHSRKS